MDATVRPLTKRKPRAPTARAKDVQKYTRSRISNHVDLLPNVDGNSSQARRFRDLVHAFIADMGGIDLCSQIRLGLARRLAAATVQSENFEARMIEAEQIDVGTLCTLASLCLRLSARLRLERIAKPIPGLHDEGGLLDLIARKQDDAVTIDQDPVTVSSDDG
jgi:hypothetical protein